MRVLYIYLVVIIILKAFDHGFKGDMLLLIYSVLHVIICINLTFLLYKKVGSKALLHPTFLTSLVFFVISFGLTNLSYVSFNGKPPMSSWLTDYFGFDNPFKFVNPIMFWSLLAHLSMWFGSQYEGLKNNTLRFIKQSTFLSQLNKKQYINIKLVKVLYLTSLVFKLVMISLGIYGFTSSPEAALQYQDIKGILIIITSFSQIAFFLIVIDAFKENKNKLMVYVYTSLEIFFGLLAGFKSQLFMPFAILGFGYFYSNSKISLAYLAILFFAIQISYEIITPFRREVGFLGQGKKYDVSDILNAYVLSQQNKKELAYFQREDQSNFVDALDRANLSGPTGLAYQYFLKHGAIAEYRIPERLFTLPLMVIVPNSIWHNKPENNLGGLSYNIILGREEQGAAFSVSGIGYAFLGFGTLWVIIPMFLLLGVIQNFYGQVLYIFGTAGLILYLSNLFTMIYFTEFTFFLISCIRNLFYAFVGMQLLLKKNKT